MSEYSQYRNKILKISTNLSNKIAKYSTFTASIDSIECNTELQTKLEIETLISDLSSNIENLNRLLLSNNISHNDSKFYQLSRNRDELARHKQDFQRISNQITNQRDRLNLLSNIKSDISSSQQQLLDDENYMLDERARIDQQHNIVDNLITQVLETRDEIFRQRNILSSVTNKLDLTLNKIPGINILLNKIDQRHRKEAIILVLVILICLIVLWFSL